MIAKPMFASPTKTEDTPVSVHQTFTQDCLPMAIAFHCRDARIHSFPYGHFLHALYESNPDVEYQPGAPPERILLSFSTHDVVLLGWNLKDVVDLLGHTRLKSVVALDARYHELTEHLPFVSEISVEELKA